MGPCSTPHLSVRARLRLAFWNRPREQVRRLTALAPALEVGLVWARWTPRHTRMEVDLTGPSSDVDRLIRELRSGGVGVRRLQEAI